MIARLFNRRARSLERARLLAQAESDAIRARLLRRAEIMLLAEANRPAISRQLEGELVEVWL